jgi:hypothetical protein
MSIFFSFLPHELKKNGLVLSLGRLLTYFENKTATVEFAVAVEIIA